MLRFVLSRLAQAVVTTLAALVVVFVAIRMLPTNPVLAAAGRHAVPEQIEAEMARQGWDRPVLVQAKDFLWGLLTRGELGDSFFRPNETVVAGLMRTVPATIELAAAALAIAIPLGIAAGIAAAVWRNRLPDYLCMSGALIGVSVPVFFLGICLMVAFPQMPSGGRLPLGTTFRAESGFVIAESLLEGRHDVSRTALRHLCLPAIALASIPTAIIARITRSSMLEVLSTDYVRTARAKGGPRRRVVLRHALPNAAIPIANIAGLQAGLLLSGAVLTESVFNWPGLGRHLVDAVRQSDYNVVQGCTLLIAGVFVTVNLVLDVLYAWLDPRVKRNAE